MCLKGKEREGERKVEKKKKKTFSTTSQKENPFETKWTLE